MILPLEMSLLHVFYFHVSVFEIRIRLVGKS